MTTLTASQALGAALQAPRPGGGFARAHPDHGEEGQRRPRLEDDWRSIQETLYLLSIPGMRESIRKGLKGAGREMPARSQVSELAARLHPPSPKGRQEAGRLGPPPKAEALLDILAGILSKTPLTLRSSWETVGRLFPAHQHPPPLVYQVLPEIKASRSSDVDALRVKAISPVQHDLDVAAHVEIQLGRGLDRRRRQDVRTNRAPGENGRVLAEALRARRAGRATSRSAASSSRSRGTRPSGPRGPPGRSAPSSAASGSPENEADELVDALGVGAEVDAHPELLARDPVVGRPDADVVGPLSFSRRSFRRRVSRIWERPGWRRGWGPCTRTARRRRWPRGSWARRPSRPSSSRRPRRLDAPIAPGLFAAEGRQAGQVALDERPERVEVELPTKTKVKSLASANRSR